MPKNWVFSTSLDLFGHFARIQSFGMRKGAHSRPRCLRTGNGSIVFRFFDLFLWLVCAALRLAHKCNKICGSKTVCQTGSGCLKTAGRDRPREDFPARFACTVRFGLLQMRPASRGEVYAREGKPNHIIRWN